MAPNREPTVPIHAPPPTSLVRHFTFAHDDAEHDLVAITYRDQPVFIARAVGVALGYAQEGRRLVTKITSDWADEFIPGTDYVVLAAEELSAFKSIIGDGTDAVPSATRSSLLLLTESGVRLACMRTSKPVGVALRRWLVDEVLPSIAETGAYVAPGAQVEANRPPEVDAATVLEIERARADAERARADAERFRSTGSVITEFVRAGKSVPWSKLGQALGGSPGVTAPAQAQPQTPPQLTVVPLTREPAYPEGFTLSLAAVGDALAMTGQAARKALEAEGLWSDPKWSWHGTATVINEYGRPREEVRHRFAKGIVLELQRRLRGPLLNHGASAREEG